MTWAVVMCLAAITAEGTCLIRVLRSVQRTHAFNAGNRGVKPFQITCREATYTVWCYLHCMSLSSPQKNAPCLRQKPRIEKVGPIRIFAVLQSHAFAALQGPWAVPHPEPVRVPGEGPQDAQVAVRAAGHQPPPHAHAPGVQPRHHARGVRELEEPVREGQPPPDHHRGGGRSQGPPQQGPLVRPTPPFLLLCHRPSPRNPHP